MRRQRTADETGREEERQLAPPEPSWSPAAELLTMQQTLGNAAVSRMVARAPVTAPPGPTSTSSEYDKARAARDAFVLAGKKGPVTYNPSARNPANYYGGFDVAYDPAAQTLQIIVKGAIKFLPGMALKSGLAEAKEASPEAAAAADAINALPAADRAAEVTKWQWSKDGGPDKDDETAFLDAFKSIVVSTWQGKHPFHCSKRYWEDLGADTVIDIQIAEGDQGAADHMKMNAFKVPPTMSIAKADVTRTTKAKGAFGNTLTLNSSTVGPKSFNLLVWDIGFDPGTTNLTAAAKATLTKLGGEMPDAPAGATIPANDVTAKVPGADDAARQARFTAVRDALTATGMTAGRVKFEAAGAGDAGQVVVGDGKVQTTVAHEMGHMFGLDDEYTGGGKYAPGKKTEHTDFAAKAGFKGAQHARSDSIMGSGTNVRPHHYVTFLDALKVVSGMNEWEYGKARHVWDPSQVGDFPLGGPGGTAPSTPPDTALA
ncbi:MAG TPA: hypothetical protein VE526_15810 [Solirubrobacteraceae bacterium]|jgi:hypothetical protein|nr:hypothetical protein [Solirubrobacteraceae bacterium]